MQHVDVLIIGAGISGIGAACYLRMHHPDLSLSILEGRDALGGTWDLFRYPGIRSDSDMYTFGYKFKPWVQDKDIATGDAILDYLQETVDEYRLGNSIRFGHRVQRASWSTEDRRWVVTARRGGEDGETFEMSCRFLLTCTGYYNYEHGHLPKFPGFDEYRGAVAHPQHWPEDLDYAGKRVLIIGSGATAVTLVPAMAKTAEHVTMLQRSPTYVFSRPAEDAIAKGLRKALPRRLAHTLTRAKNIGIQRYAYRMAKLWPALVRKNLRKLAAEQLGPNIDVDVHFKPKYDPWDQRLCLIPDGDLYAALREGDASIVTDTIERFTETGVVLDSGKTIDADVVVPATGLELQFLGGMEMDVDGTPVDPADLVIYKGMMFSNVPNWIAFLGYTSASWTLKVDLTGQFLTRLLRHMKKHGYDMVVPRMDEPSLPLQPVMSKLASAGYVRRSADRLPKQATKKPWVNRDAYLGDLLSVKLGRIDDGVLKFSSRGARTHRSRFSFRGKTAVVTGAASGIGEALAHELAARGCNLALIDINGNALERVASEVRSKGVNVSMHVMDMGDASAIEDFPTELSAAHRHVDLLINNAGVALGGQFEEASSEDFEWLMNINFYGVVNMTRALLPMLRQRPDAHIANVSSIFGIIAPGGQSAYCASKFAVRGFSEALRHELADTNVGVSVIHPGGIKTSIARNARIAEGVDVPPSEREEEIEKYERNFITAPSDAAKTILAGIEARRPRIMVGPDARLMEWVERLFPTRNVDLMERIRARQQAAS
jgi:cation diffusion facilitator CzcD-associated flavoprotein CzcO/short-subunit dehydrogenase